MRRHAATVLLVGCLLLAGCSGFGGSTTTGGPSTTDTANATTTTATTATPPPTTTTPAVETLVPGVTEAGLRNPVALFDAHAAALNETGYVSTTNVTIRYPGAEVSPARYHFEAAVPADGSPYRIERVNSGGFARPLDRTIWSNGSVRVSRTVVSTGERRRVSYDSTSPAPVGPDPSGRVLVRLLAVGDYRTASVEGSGEDRRIVLVANASIPSRGAELNVTDYSGRVVVDGAGRIRSARITLNVTQAGRRAVQVARYESRPADVAVERPDWVGTAVLRGAYDLRATVVEGSYIRLTNVGDRPLEPGQRVIATQSGTVLTAVLNDTVPTGGTVYLYRPSDGGDPVVTATRPGPNETGSLAGRWGIRLVTADGDPLTRAVALPAGERRLRPAAPGRGR